MDGMVKGMLVGVIGLVIVVTILGATIGTVATAGNTVNATGYPLASLFASNSILPLIFLGAGLIAVISLAFSYVKAKR
jgi:hypothetical protein